jgi:hypothetical protein
VPDPVLITAVVRKQHALAVLLDRGEQEVITFKAKRINVQPIA